MSKQTNGNSTGSYSRATEKQFSEIPLAELEKYFRTLSSERRAVIAGLRYRIHDKVHCDAVHGDITYYPVHQLMYHTCDHYEFEITFEADGETRSFTGEKPDSVSDEEYTFAVIYAMRIYEKLHIIYNY